MDTKVESAVTLRGEWQSSRDIELAAAVRQTAKSVAEGDTGNLWLQRVLLVQHIDQVQHKILYWMDEIDKRIEGMSYTYTHTDMLAAVIC